VITQSLEKILGRKQSVQASEIRHPFSSGRQNSNTEDLEIVDAYIVNDPTKADKFWQDLLKNSKKLREEFSYLSDIDKRLPFVDIKVRNLSNQPIFLKEISVSSTPIQAIDDATRNEILDCYHMKLVANPFSPTSYYHIRLDKSFLSTYSEQEKDDVVKISQLVKPNDVDRFLLIISCEPLPEYVRGCLKSFSRSNFMPTASP
jgi:hypothetical protein